VESSRRDESKDDTPSCLMKIDTWLMCLKMIKVFLCLVKTNLLMVPNWPEIEQKRTIGALERYDYAELILYSLVVTS